MLFINSEPRGIRCPSRRQDDGDTFFNGSPIHDPSQTSISLVLSWNFDGHRFSTPCRPSCLVLNTISRPANDFWAATSAKGQRTLS